MKVTKNYLKQLIKEEVSLVEAEQSLERTFYQAFLAYIQSIPKGPERDKQVDMITNTVKSWHSSNSSNVEAAAAAAKRLKRRLSDYSWAAEKNAGLDEPDEGGDEYY